MESRQRGRGSGSDGRKEADSCAHELMTFVIACLNQPDETPAWRGEVGMQFHPKRRTYSRAARGRRVSRLEERSSPWLGNSTSADSHTSNNIWTAPTGFSGGWERDKKDTKFVKKR